MSWRNIQLGSKNESLQSKVDSLMVNEVVAFKAKLQAVTEKVERARLKVAMVKIEKNEVITVRMEERIMAAKSSIVVVNLDYDATVIENEKLLAEAQTKCKGPR
ncbi:hypothetical protein Adt_03999 [Abeliophyllum distichum]|uniref:Uncharacterized protein n=1 Tax=Abeliophyllum distichum TaxID=126358 RepID=A0ABD1W0J1_9LAMI